MKRILDLDEIGNASVIRWAEEEKTSMRTMLADATPGPWHVTGEQRPLVVGICGDVQMRDARLIAALRNAAPDLLRSLSFGEHATLTECRDAVAQQIADLAYGQPAADKMRRLRGVRWEVRGTFADGDAVEIPRSTLGGAWSLARCWRAKPGVTGVRVIRLTARAKPKGAKP